MNHTLCLVVLTTTLLVSACATAREPAAPPNYQEIAGDTAPANARLYVGCLRQASESGQYRRADDGGDELLLFTCDGGAARAFFEALGPWSAQIGSEFAADGRVYRSTAKVQRNLFGVDHCSAAADADHRCVLSFNAGDFLDQ